MANEIAKTGVFGGKVGMLNPEALKAAMADSATKDPRGSAPDGADYMNFSGKRGVYEIGIEKKDTDPDELWLVNVPAFEDGWVCWKENRTVATRLFPLGTPPQQPDMNEHGPFTRDGDGWYQAKSLSAKSIDTGQQVYFKINSVSGVSVFAGLQKEITDRLRSGQPYWPVVKFSKEPFMAQGFKNHKPIITIDGWLSDEVMMKLAGLFEDDDAELDMAELYSESLGAPPAVTGNGAAAEAKPEVATRKRRAL